MKVIFPLNSRKSVLGFGFILLTVLFGCRRSQEPLLISPLVKTVEVKGHEGQFAITYPGRIRAAADVKLAFRVAGPLQHIYVSEGEYVKKGQLLASMDPRDYRLQYEAAKAEYTQVKGEADRIIELYRRNSVSVNEYDKAVSARERVSALYNARKNSLEDTRLKAPFNGYIQKKYFDAYEIVNQGTPVLSMIDDDYLEVDIDLPSVDYIRREEFQDFYVRVDVYPDATFPLELMEISQQANFNQLFQARFRLKRDRKWKLSPGMSASVTIRYTPGAENLTVIPVSSMVERSGRTYVWLYDAENEVVRLFPVDVRQVLKDGQVIVSSGLRSGERIVSAGVNSLKDGQKVRLLPPVPASNVGGLL